MRGRTPKAEVRRADAKQVVAEGAWREESMSERFFDHGSGSCPNGRGEDGATSNASERAPQGQSLQSYRITSLEARRSGAPTIDSVRLWRDSDSPVNECRQLRLQQWNNPCRPKSAGSPTGTDDTALHAGARSGRTPTSTFVSFVTDLIRVGTFMGNPSADRDGPRQTTIGRFRSAHSHVAVQWSWFSYQRRPNIPEYSSEDWNPAHRGDLESWNADVVPCLDRNAPDTLSDPYSDKHRYFQRRRGDR